MVVPCNMFALVGVGTIGGGGNGANELVFDASEGEGELSLVLVAAGETLLLLTGSCGLVPPGEGRGSLSCC